MDMSSGGEVPDAAIEHGEHTLVRIKDEEDLERYVGQIAQNLQFDALNSSQSAPESMSPHQVRQLYDQYLQKNAHGAVFLLTGRAGVEAMVTVRTPTGMGHQATVEKLMVNSQSGLKAMLRPLMEDLYEHLKAMECREAVIFTDAGKEARDALTRAIPLGTLSGFFSIQQKKVEGPGDAGEPRIVGESRGK